MRTQTLANARRTSVNGLIRDLLLQLDQSEREKELARAYDLLGKDTDSDVEANFAAQAEVARRG